MKVKIFLIKFRTLPYLHTFERYKKLNKWTLFFVTSFEKVLFKKMWNIVIANNNILFAISRFIYPCTLWAYILFVKYYNDTISFWRKLFRFAQHPRYAWIHLNWFVFFFRYLLGYFQICKCSDKFSFIAGFTN